MSLTHCDHCGKPWINHDYRCTPAAGSSAPACSVGFCLNTLPHMDGKIVQELQEYNGDLTRTLTRWVMDSREKGVHDALVQLGWTPPNGCSTKGGAA